MPRVSIIMSVYNGEKFLKECIDSILRQSYEDFEFIIFNDASTDNSLEIIKSYDDSRIKLINNLYNIGLTKNLNTGINISCGEFIARMDDDDISIKTRIEKQVLFFDKHLEIDICGSWCEIFGDCISSIWKCPQNHDKIKTNLLFYNVMAHPSIMMRKKSLDEYSLRYDEYFVRSQDYDLWVRSSKYLKLSNINKVLLKHRIHKNQVSSTQLNKQILFSYAIRNRQLRELDINLDENNMQILNEVINGAEIVVNTKKLENINLIFTRIIENNYSLHIYNHFEIKKFIAVCWINCLCNLLNVIPINKDIMHIIKINKISIPIILKIKLLLFILRSLKSIISRKK